MKVFVDFFINYWREILEIFILIVSVVLCCIRKKPVKVVDTVKESIVRLLPYCINQAEQAAKGEKLGVCLNLLKSVLENLGIEFTESYQEFAREQVEIILSTPQKKEAK